MKNIVKVLRFKDNATRLYQIPTGMVLDRGTVVEVEFAGGSAFGVTVSKSYCGDTEESMIRDMFNVLPGADFKKVIAVCEKSDVAWQTDDETADDVQADSVEE